MTSLCTVLSPYLEKKSKVISISGPSASGKTTLALELISKISREENSIWIQASEHFPRRRLDSLLPYDESQKAYVMRNTFLVPATHVVMSFEELRAILINLNYQDFPPETRFIVIDNISHHLRYALSQCGEVGVRSKIVNSFFDEILFPLIMRCFREGIHLILIHEVSQDIETGKTRSFYSKLFNRIDSLAITFSGMTRMGTQRVSIETAIKCIFEGKYDITSNGITLTDLSFINSETDVIHEFP